MKNNGFIEIRDIESLDQFLAESKDGPVVLFKHSNSCGISAMAHREMKQIQRPVGLVTVQNARAVSNEIEERFDLPHETPQVLIVRDGKVAWNASHSQIRANAVQAAMESVSSKQ